MKIVVPDELEETQRLRKWLKMLPKPIAVMAANDFCGHRLLNACQDEAINVPEQVAVIGVNNDELVCELCFPTLTSVSTNTEQVGHKAAEVLDQLMAGATFTQRKIEIEPLGIEPRQSTDRTAGADPFVVLAFRFIQQHACDGINVEDVLKVVPMSRSLLESSFRQLIGRSPHHETSIAAGE
jgi:LacI family transcriptional regulator